MSVAIRVGDALTLLRAMPPESIHMVVTSPPYYGLRDYGVEGQIGLEPTPDAYVARMVEVFREVRRVLRNDGTLWLNIGDSYENMRQSTANRNGLKPKDLIGIPWMLAFALRADGWYLRRDIIWHKPNPMPESVTDRPTSAHEYLFLLTKSGAPTYWTHRDHAGTGVRPAPDYRWQQTDDNGRVIAEQDFEPPGFRKDWPHWKRINLWDGHDYFYDATAVAEPCLSGPSDVRKMIEGLDRIGGKHKSLTDPRAAASSKTTMGQKRSVGNGATRNHRSVWTIATAPFRGTHFATFPPALVEPCILAGTSERGVCPKCAAPWGRVITKTASGEYARDGLDRGTDARGIKVRAGECEAQTIGWRPTCSCNAGAAPATVIDPFFGAGTTGLVAQQQGRHCIGIELNPEYAEMARLRVLGAPLKVAA